MANNRTRSLPGSVGVGDSGGIVRLDDVTNTQGRRIPDATPKNSGVMTKRQAGQLAVLVAGGGSGGSAFAPTVPRDWPTSPTTISDALDALAEKGRAYVFSSNFAGADLGARINAADAFIGAGYGTIEVPMHDVAQVTTRISLSANRKLILRRGVYTSNIPDGAWLLFKDNTKIVGDGWDTILQESTDTSLASELSLRILINAYNFTNNFADGPSNVVFQDFRLQGASTIFGSAAQALELGNAHNAIVQRLYFDSTRTEGLGVGTTAESGYFATNVWIEDCLFEHVASQNIGAVNVSGLHIISNTFKAGGQPGGPGCSYIDFEPNGADDRDEVFEIIGNLIDARGSANPGNGIIIQDPTTIRKTCGTGTIAGNTILGEWNGADISTGIYIIGVHEVNVVGNTLRRCSMGISLDGGAKRCSVRGNQLTACGGGGLSSMSINGTYNIIAGNDIFMTDENAGVFPDGNQDPSILEGVGSDYNIFKNNYVDYYYEQSPYTGGVNAPGGTIELVGAHSVSYGNVMAGRCVDRSSNHVSVNTVAASQGIGLRDHYLFVDTTAGDVTLTMIDAASMFAVAATPTEGSGRRFVFRRVAGAGSIIVVPAATDTIEGAPNLTISDNNKHEIVSDGTMWRIM